MDFSAPIKYSGVAAFSPDGKLLASAAGVRLCVRDVKSLETRKVHTCVDKIGALEWSADSLYILCVLAGRDIIQVFAVDSLHQAARIEEGLGGLRSARWLPSGRHVLSVADYAMRATVWSLLDKDDARAIKQPKCNDAQELVVSFTLDGKYMALVERRDCKDFLLVVDLDSFVVVRRWEVEGSGDIQLLRWSPDGCHLCCVDGLFAYRVLVYTLDGRLLAAVAPAKAVLGTKCAAWAPDGRLLAVGGYDGTVRLISHLTWKDFVCFGHPGVVSSPSAFVFREEEVREASPEDVRRFKYVVAPQPYPVPQRQASDKAPRLGVTEVAFSPDGQYLCSVDEASPQCVWVWAMARMGLEAVVVQQKAVRAVQWHPTLPRLGICTGDRRFYIWSAQQCSCVDMVDPDFTVKGFAWSADGRCLLLEDRAAFSLAYPRWEAA